jgi:protein involved in polysaccharide export with SLBB domain
MKQLRLLLSLAWLALIFTTLSSAWAQAPYRLAAGDTVELKFFYNPELNETVQIRPDGTISLALIGDVQMSGKTASDVSAELQQRYRTIVKDPANTVQIRTYGRQIVYVGGEVARPGSVLEAVLDAGGPRVTAASSVVLIRQNEKGVPVSQVISIKSQHRNVPQAAGIQLQAFDVLLLPESKIAQVDRWVDQYIKQVLPGQLNGGFTYLFNGAITGL